MCISNPSGVRRIWSIMALAGLVVLGVFAAVSKEIASVLFWPLWFASLMGWVKALFPKQEGVVLLRKEMAPYDLPENAKIPVTLVAKAESESGPKRGEAR